MSRSRGRARTDLCEREERALAATGTTPAEMVALAAERDEIAADRDALTTAYDDRATAPKADGA